MVNKILVKCVRAGVILAERKAETAVAAAIGEASCASRKSQTERL